MSAASEQVIKQRCTLHGASYEEANGKMWVGALTGGVLARIGASAIKAIPYRNIDAMGPAGSINSCAKA